MDHVSPTVVCGRGIPDPSFMDAQEQAQAHVSLSQGVAVGDNTTGSTTGHSDCIISGRAGC